MSINPIRIETLEILDAIDRRGSFAKAAEELNKATSALSYAIQKIEDQLDITVFHRQGRRSVLTPAGRLLLDEGRNILKATSVLATKAKEMATGWEPKIRIAVELNLDYSHLFQAIGEVLQDHPGLEIDISECVLNGGWDALENDRVDLIVGTPGPVPQQKGIRGLKIKTEKLVPVIASGHLLAGLASNKEALEAALPNIRRIITHDTSVINIAISAGLGIGKQTLYVQTIDQKIQAQLAGLGIGHLPRHRIQKYLDNGMFVELNLTSRQTENFIAWKIANKGKALHAIAQALSLVNWQGPDS